MTYLRVRLTKDIMKTIAETKARLKKLIKSNEFKKFQIKNKKNINLWEKIYWRRKDLQLTQLELSNLSWIPQNKISELENWNYWEPWFDLIENLSIALEIDFDYLNSKDITRKTFEVFQYIASKIKWNLDIMQFMKIPYFIDLESSFLFKKFITNFVYIRYNYWPFDKKVYSYQKTFSWNEDWFEKFKITYLQKEELEIIDWVLKKYPVSNWKKLKELSYKTSPMKKLNATLWWNENMDVLLDFECSL